MVRRGFQQHWLLLSFVFVIIVAATVAGFLLTKDRYEATSTFVVEPSSEEVSTQLLAYLIPTIEARVTGPSVEAEVRTSLPADLQEAEWTVSTDVAPGTGVMDVTIQADDEGVPVPVANGYADVVSTLDVDTDALEVEQIDPATSADTTSQRAVLLASGIGLAILVPLLLAAALGASNRRKEEADQRHFVAHDDPGRDVDFRVVRPVANHH